MAHIRRTGAAMAAALAGACSSSETRAGGGETGTADTAVTASSDRTELRVSNVMIGRQIGPGNRITDPTFQFAPKDTVYVSVATVGTDGATTLTAAWRSQSGEILHQASAPVPEAGENAEFRLSQPKGFKPGNYKVIVFLGGDSVETRVFAVRK